MYFLAHVTVSYNPEESCVVYAEQLSEGTRLR
jgi:hypothetical protein